MVSDFICDLMHWCDHNAVYTGDEEQIVPFDTQVEHGRYHYVEEVAEEQEGSDEASV